MGLKTAPLLLLCLCGLSVSEHPTQVKFPSLDPQEPLPSGPLRAFQKKMVPVSNVFVSGSSVTENYNNTVVETCTAEGTSLTFKWFNGSTEIVGDGYRIHVAQTENSGTLTFSPIYRFDLASDTYCEVSNAISKVRSSKFSSVISFVDGMTIFPEAPPAYVASQSDFSLKCSTSDESVINIRWHLNGAELNTTGPTLTLKDIEKEGLGTTRSLYTCNATGVTTGKSRLSMPVVFTIIDSISGVKLNSSVIEKDSASLNCSATAGFMQTFKWLKDGATLNSNDRVVISADMKSVLIKPPQKEDNGEYTCEVSNPVSTLSARTTLNGDFPSGGAIAGIVSPTLTLAICLFVRLLFVNL